MNKDQRKYIQARVLTVFEAKKREITAKFQVPLPFPEKGSRVAYIQKAFKKAGLPFTYTGNTYSTDHIQTDVDVQWKKDVEAAKVKENAALLTLSKLRTEVMDEVMLGTDAAVMTAALAKLESFKVE